MIMMLFSISVSYGTITITKDTETNIVTIEQTSIREIGLALQNNTLSTVERDMITSATGFILSGPFANDPDLMQLAQKNSSITVLDMGDCDISPNNLMIPATWKNTLTEFVIPTHSQFNRLPQNFLEGFTKIKTITIPANIKTIENMALANMTISEITIPATLDRIKKGAFAQTIVLHDVYVESRHTVCDLNAFDFETLVGQTNVEHIYTYAAKLHYPDTPEDYEYFVGSWKEGKTLTQNNLVGFKDGLWEWNGLYVEYVGPWNGWQQFALSDNSEPFIMTNGSIRTYSDSYEHDRLPSSSDVQIRVYRGVGYDKNGNITMRPVWGSFRKYGLDGKPKYYYCIPKNTGVVLVTKTNKSYIHYFAKTNNNIKQYPYYWKGSNEGDSYGNNNLLEVSITPIPVAPVWRNKATNKIEFRNFGLYNGRWKRLTNSTSRANRAYLKMPASVFTNNNEGENEGPGNEGLGNAKRFITFNNITDLQEEDDGPEYIGFDFPNDDEEIIKESNIIFLYADPNDVIIPSNGGIATNVANIVETQDNNYYTLQGIRVKNPSKGVYIKNGKKVIVK